MMNSSKPKQKSCVAAMAFSCLVPLILGGILIFPTGREGFFALTASHPYVLGFLKFAFLATTGEIYAARISTGAFAFSKGALAKAGVWGLIGVMMTLLMPVYSAGLVAAQASGFLPGSGNAFATALFTSLVMNFSFGLAMMAFHRVTDTMIEQKNNGGSLSPLGAVGAIDWPGFVSFVVFKAVPFFWVPAHTVTFLLAPQYRVFLSAVLSILLGLLQAMAKRKTAGPQGSGRRGSR